MSEFHDGASAFGLTEEENGAGGSSSGKFDVSPQAFKTFAALTHSPPVSASVPSAAVAQPRASTPATPSSNKTSSQTYDGYKDEGRGVAGGDDRSPLPRLPHPIVISDAERIAEAGDTSMLPATARYSEDAASASNSAAHDEAITVAKTAASSTMWCSPVQVLPNRIVHAAASGAGTGALMVAAEHEHRCMDFPNQPMPSDAAAMVWDDVNPAAHAGDSGNAAAHGSSPLSHLDSTPSPTARPTATYTTSFEEMGSGERRSVTVTQHPLDNASGHSKRGEDFVEKRAGCYGFVDGKSAGEHRWPSAVSGEADDPVDFRGGGAVNTTTTSSVAAAGAVQQRHKARLFSPDFESPGRAAEEMQEWRSREQVRAGLTAVPVMEALAAAPSSSSAAQAIGSTTSHVPDSLAAEGTRSTAATLSHKSESCPTSPPPPSDAPAAVKDSATASEYGVVSSGSAAEKSVQPTPYPVTSTSSLSDWSSAPRLGFPAPVSPTAAGAEADSVARRDAEERKREDKWYRLCRGVSLLASASPEAIVRLRSAARELGIPHHLRAVMWLTLTGMALKVDENEYFCAKLLRRNGYVTGPNADAIAADVQRTFPGHPYFSERDVGIYKLTNVLHALCWRNPLLSYCQSFNFLAAFLLLVLDDEERAFWLLVYIFEQLLPNDFYGETLLGANVEQAVLERLVQQKLPRVAAKFAAAGLQVHTLVANWMMSLFVNVFPPSTALRLWDYFFCRTTFPGERTPAHLEITLAVLKYLDDKNALAGEDAGELLMALREQTACLYDAAAVIRVANTFAISPDELHQLRREAKPAVVQHMKARERARASEQERRIAQELQFARNANAINSSKTGK